MQSRAGLLFVLVVPVAAATAWITVRCVSPDAPAARAPADGDLTARVEKLERALDAQRAATPRDDRSIARRLDAIEALAAGRSATSQALEVAGAEGSVPRADDGARPAVAVGLAAEPGAADHRESVRQLAGHLVKSAGPPLSETEFSWAAGLLDRESRRGRVSPQEAEDLAASLAALPSGHAARPAIAKAVAVGWGHDARLGGFLERFAANTEPSVHAGVLAVLDDEHPGTAFSEYVLRLAREERDLAVLSAAIDLDHVEAAATAANAPRLVQVIEARVLEGTFDSEMRARAGLAVAVASLRTPETGVAALRRLADRETDTKLAERLRLAASSVQSGDATLKSLEQFFE